jgi:hypothetical protein
MWPRAPGALVGLPARGHTPSVESKAVTGKTFQTRVREGRNPMASLRLVSAGARGYRTARARHGSLTASFAKARSGADRRRVCGAHRPDSEQGDDPGPGRLPRLEANDPDEAQYRRNEHAEDDENSDILRQSRLGLRSGSVAVLLEHLRPPVTPGMDPSTPGPPILTSGG